jgi:saccharopine dehydrogenase (NAD+, L-lysine-forming)
LDSAGLSPVAPGESPGVLEQLKLDAAYRDRGVTALVSMGSDPGVSNIMARVAADRLAAVEEIRVLKGATGGGDAKDYPLYSREIFLRDALSPPTIWEGGRLVPQPYVGGEEDYEFPPPIGTKRVYCFYHEEVLTLPLRLGRPVSRVIYKHDINPDLVRSIVALHVVGLLAPEKKLKIGTAQMTFRDAFLATFPEPSTLVGPLSGAMGIVIEVKGTKADGSRAAIRGSILVDHREANRRRGTTAERFLTATVAGAAVDLLREKKLPRTGVLAPEELPPEAIVSKLAARDVKFQIEELPV